MAYSKKIKIDGDGPKIVTNDKIIFSDISLSLKDFAPEVSNWSTINKVLDKDEFIEINDKWDFIFVRLRWLDKPSTGTNDGALSIYEACSSNSTIKSNCGCSSEETASTGKTAFVPSLATFETTQYTTYVLSDTFAYLDTTLEAGPTGATAGTYKTEDLYDYVFPGILSNDTIFFKDVSAMGPGATGSNPYDVIDELYYSYTNQAKDVILIYDYDNSEWVLISTDTDLSAAVIDGTENIAINILNSVSWSSESYELGNSSIFLPELENSNGEFTIENTIDLIDENMPVTFKFSEILTLWSKTFTGKITSDFDNQEVHILLGK